MFDIFDIAMARKAGGGGSSGGEGESHPLDAYIEGTSTEIVSTAKSVGNRIFNFKGATKAHFPNATSIGDEAFYQCKALTSAKFPLVVNIGSNAFQTCTSLIEIDFPLVESIDSNAFKSCNKLENVYLPKLKSVKNQVFQYCYALKTVDLPELITDNSQVFANCTALTYANLPKLRTSYNLFYACTALSTLVIGVKYINVHIMNLTSLNTLVLTSETLVTLQNVSAFDGTPFASGGTGGTVYVPQALIEEYKTATNWSTFYEGGTVTFLPIEGSEFE